MSIVQSAYIPWRGYFDLIGLADEFVLYDVVAYSKNSWRNRNRILAQEGAQWLTIPVKTAGRFGAPIDSIEVADRRWALRHWKSIAGCYARAPHFHTYHDLLRDLYEQAAAERLLSRVNELFLRRLAEVLGILTPIRRADEFDLPDDRILRLVAICEQAGADAYLTGPAARAYLSEEPFRERGIVVNWMDYSGYRPYRQCWDHPFVPDVSVLDLLLNEGPESLRWLKCASRWDGPRTVPPRAE